MEEKDSFTWSRQKVAILAIALSISLIAAGSYASYVGLYSKQSSAAQGPVVKVGDTISVDYIGMFEDGTVFDTTIRRVAENNTQYPKSPSFVPRNEYPSMSFLVGSGQMIPGFDKAVVGMAVNQTAVVTITPEEGYGFPDESLIEAWDLYDRVQIFEWVGNTTIFADTYQAEPNIGTNVKNPVYGWNMTVYHIDPITDKVLVKNNPFVGQILQSSHGWSSRVVSIDSSANMGNGEIVIMHQIPEEDMGKSIFRDAFERPFSVSAVNTVAGTITIDFNRDVVGKTLIFKITVLEITQSG